MEFYMANQNNLQHFGVRGMHWGVRRIFQDKRSPEHKETKTLLKKKVSQMSNAELKKVTARLQLEKQYKDLTKKEVSAGQKLANELLGSLGKQILMGVLKKYATKENFDSAFRAAADAARKRKAGGVIDLKFLPSP
jgi:hypothetical protein